MLAKICVSVKKNFGKHMQAPTLINRPQDSLAIMMVRELPPRLSLRSQVRTESLYGMKDFFSCLFVEISAEKNKMCTNVPSIIICKSFQ